MFSKITISLLHYISVFKILLQLFLLINSLLVLRNLISVSFNGLMLPRKSLIFITKKVKGLQSSKKRLKLIQYFKEKIGSTGVLFLQETHSNSKIEQKWIEDFKRSSFLFSRKSKFLYCPNRFLWKRNFFCEETRTDKEGRILILDVSVNDSEYIWINFYNTEKEQIDV